MRKTTMTAVTGMLVLVAAGCSGKITNTTLTLNSIPHGMASLSIVAPQFTVDWTVDAGKMVEETINGVKGLLSAIGIPADIFGAANRPATTTTAMTTAGLPAGS